MFAAKSCLAATPSTVRGGGRLWEASLREARPPSKDLTQLCQVGMAREDEEFFLLSHSNRKTGQAEKAGRVV